MNHFTQLRGGGLTVADFRAGADEVERRGESRVARERQIAIMPFGIGQGLEFRRARLTDCSRQGIAVVAEHPLPPGNQFLIKAKLKEFVLLIYTVKDCLQADARYRIGARLDGILGTS